MEVDLGNKKVLGEVLSWSKEILQLREFVPSGKISAIPLRFVSKIRVLDEKEKVARGT